MVPSRLVKFHLRWVIMKFVTKNRCRLCKIFQLKHQLHPSTMHRRKFQSNLQSRTLKLILVFPRQSIRRYCIFSNLYNIQEACMHIHSYSIIHTSHYIIPHPQTDVPIHDLAWLSANISSEINNIRYDDHLTTAVQVNGCTKVEEPARDIHIVCQVAPRGQRGYIVNVLVPSWYVYGNRYRINNDDVTIGTKVPRCCNFDVAGSIWNGTDRLVNGDRMGTDYLNEDVPTPAMNLAPTPATIPTILQTATHSADKYTNTYFRRSTYAYINTHTHTFNHNNPLE